MILNFGRTRSPGGSSHEMGDGQNRRRKDSLQRIGEPDLSIFTSGVLRLIDTHSGSHNIHYVN